LERNVIVHRIQRICGHELSVIADNDATCVQMVSANDILGKVTGVKRFFFFMNPYRIWYLPLMRTLRKIKHGLSLS